MCTQRHFSHRENSSDLDELNQIWILITLFRFIDLDPNGIQFGAKSNEKKE